MELITFKRQLKTHYSTVIFIRSAQYTNGGENGTPRSRTWRSLGEPWPLHTCREMNPSQTHLSPLIELHTLVTVLVRISDVVLNVY